MLSGASNFLAVALVARVLSPESFGEFALAYSALTFVLGATRTYFGNRLVLGGDRDEVRARTGPLLGALVLLAPLLVGGVLGVSVLAVGTDSLGLLLVVAIATPVVCLQDVVRVACASTGRPGVALVSDGAWVAVMVGVLLWPRPLGAPATLVAWAAAALLAAVLALGLARQRPRLAAGWSELRLVDRQGTSLALSGMVSTLGALTLLWLVARVVDDGAAGSLRGAATAMGPVNVLLSFSAVGVTAQLARRARARDLAFCAGVAAVLCLCSLSWGALLLVVPPGVGAAAFGASWPGIRSVLPWTVGEYAFLCVLAAATAGLKVRRRGAEVLRARALMALAVVVVGGLVVTATRDVGRAAAVLAAAAALGSAWSWSRLTTRSPDERPDGRRRVTVYAQKSTVRSRAAERDGAAVPSNQPGAAVGTDDGRGTR